MRSVTHRWVATPSPARVFVTAFGVWLVLGATWAVASPQFSVPDEPAHALRAASVAGGEVLGDRRRVEIPGPPLTVQIEHVVEVPAGLAGAPAQPVCFFDFRDTADCIDPLRPAAGQVEIPTTAGAYQPVFYGLVGAPLQVLDPVPGLVGARLLHALVGALLLAAACATAWQLGGRMFLAVLSVTITPVAIYLLGGVNPNGLEIAAAVASWVAVIALLVRPRTTHAVLAALSLTVLAWTRPLSPAIAVGIVAAVVVGVVTRRRVAAWRRPPVVAGLGIAAAGILGAGVWLVGAGALDAFVGTPRPELTPSVAIRTSWSLTAGRLAEMVGNLGWLDTPLPAGLVVLWAVTASAVIIAAIVVGTWRQRLVLAALAGATVLLPVAAEALRAAELGLFWQGRYSLPVAVGVGVYGGWVLTADRAWRRLPASVRTAIVWVLPTVAALGHLTAHMVSMSRYSTGPGTNPVAYLWRPGWTAPPGDLALLALVVLGVSGLVAMVVLADAGTADAETGPTEVRG